MEKKNIEADPEVLLRQMAAAQKRGTQSSRVTAIAVLILAAAVIISLAVLVPAALRALDEVHVTMESAQELMRQANGSLEKFNGMTDSIETVMREGGQDMNRIADALNNTAVCFPALYRRTDSHASVATLARNDRAWTIPKTGL